MFFGANVIVSSHIRFDALPERGARDIQRYAFVKIFAAQKLTPHWRTMVDAMMRRR
jgi:hypothetical protein